MAIRTDAELITAISNLNLEPVKFKLVNKKDGKSWALDEADLVEKQYKRFLFLAGKYTEVSVVPTPAIDDFWHQHILDTQKYEVDCSNIFGYFMHHFPYFGERGEEDAQQLQQAASVTRDLYQQHFGEFMPIGATICTACNPSPPRPSCGSCGGSSCNNSIENTLKRPTILREHPISQDSWHVTSL